MEIEHTETQTPWKSSVKVLQSGLYACVWKFERTGAFLWYNNSTARQSCAQNETNCRVKTESMEARISTGYGTKPGVRCY